MALLVAMTARARRWVARTAATLLALALLLLLGGSCLVREVGGRFTHEPSQWETALSPAARALIDSAFADLPSPPVDHHVHVVGLGAGGTGMWINPKMRSWLHPILRLKFAVYLSSSAIDDVERADQQYLSRLLELARASPRPPKLCLLAFDRHWRPDGTIDEHESEVYVPNDHVLELAQRHPELVVPVMSVHPYRSDALAELERCAARGAKLCKWLPNAMGMDPADPRCDPFYDRMRELGVVLLTHAGREEAVDAADAQKLGNPLRLRRALDRGVKVIVAHCASFGEDEDLDDPARPRVPTFDLFLRMMDEKKHEGLLFGELSAMTQWNRGRRPWLVLLERTDLHSRLVNGSDYPIPAINFLVWTGDFVEDGFITKEEGELLDEIYGVNPLLYDFVLKRRLRHPTTGARFGASLFVANPALPLE